MSDTNLSEILKQQAINLGLCQQWQKEWSSEEDKQALIEKYFNGLDFPMKFHWPSNDFIKENFEQSLLWKNNILVDDTRSLLNPEEAVILGHTKAIVRVNGYSHSVLYIRDESFVRIYAKNNSFIIVHLFENAKVDVDTQDKSNVLVLKHSPEVSVIATDNVKVKEDFGYLK